MYHAHPQAKIEGCGKGARGGSTCVRPTCRTITPYHIRLEHALNIDFVNEAAGPGARVAVELTPEAARELVKAILSALDQAESGGWVEETHSAEALEEWLNSVSHARDRLPGVLCSWGRPGASPTATNLVT